jgi:hypothetical protein
MREVEGGKAQGRASSSHEDMQVEISEERRSRKRRNEDDGDEEEVKMDDTEKNGMEDVEVSAVTSEVKQMEEDIDEIAKIELEMMNDDYENEDGWNNAWDDVDGGELRVKDVRKARKEELDYMVKKGIWDVVDESECWKKTGAAPVSTRWVDRNKGTEEQPEVRSRIVARDFKGKGKYCKDREDLFAATPPLELLRFLVSMTATRKGGAIKRKMAFVDVKKAHIIPKCERDVYVQLPEELGAAAAGGSKCGKLNHWLYGFRPAAQAWEAHYSKLLVEAGFERGLSTPVIYFHEARDIACEVHGDDFTFSAETEELEWIIEKMKVWFEVKVRGILGGGDRDEKEMVILGRVLRWESWGITYEADPKQSEKIFKTFNITDESKKLTTNGTRSEDGRKEEGEDDEKLDAGLSTEFRGVAARMNYYAVDAPNIQFSTKEVCRRMATPTVGAWSMAKRLGRYILGTHKVTWEYPWQNKQEEVNVYADSDWAGCGVTRKSTSGGVIMLGMHCLKTWSSTQPVIALSSGEAEYYAMIDAATRTMGLQASMKELGTKVELVMHTDSSAAKAFASRRGAGKIRHVEVKVLWLQEAVACGRLKVKKVLGTENPADLMTKYHNAEAIKKNLAKMNIRVK